MPTYSLCNPFVVTLVTGLAAMPACAATYTPLYQFTGGPDGAEPSAALTYDEKGNLYGVTNYGGIPCQSLNVHGCGTVFKLSPSGEVTTLVTFNAANGQYPDGKLTLVDHTLYGSTFYGGGQTGNDDGVLFSVHTDGRHFKRLFVFHQNGKDGVGPAGPLLPGPTGALYGYTAFGGPRRYGVLFELLPDGTFIHLHNFTGGADGGDPTSLVSDAAGTLYGSTYLGGVAGVGKSARGVVFSYVPSTGTYTVLHAFAPGEGRNPLLGSIGPDGTLYGATVYGPRPAPNGSGSLFELVPSGGAYSLTTLYSFPNDGSPPGAYPTGGPTLTRSGALIGTTRLGGSGGGQYAGGGTLYQFKFNRMETLYNFPTYSAPVPPTLDKNGTIYGAAAGAGIVPCPTPGFSLYSGCGSIYNYIR